MKVLVIGGGPGGHVAAIKAAELGAEVTLVENFKLGGTCLHVGCIPTKILLHATELLHDFSTAGDMGITAEHVNLDFEKLHKYKNNIINNITTGVTGLVRGKQVEILYGTGALTGLNEAVVTHHDGTKTDVVFDKAILATGSEVAQIPVPGVKADCVITSNEALSLEQPPKSLVIIGGGVIGVEFATLFNRVGTKVTIVEALDTILPYMDEELVAIARKKLEKEGIAIYTGCRVQEIEEGDHGANVRFTTAHGELTVSSEKVLMAVGRRPFTKNLGLDVAGIDTERGGIKVNDYLCTNQPHIYAAGDCTGGMLLAHVATMQGIVAGKNCVLGDSQKYSNKTTPACVYIEPELASVGLTEELARKQYENIKVGKWDLSGNAKVMAMGKEGLVKFITDGDTGKVLGLHIIGPRASDMIHEGALAIQMNAHIDDIVNTIHAHPTIAESVGEAAHDVHGNAIYKMYAHAEEMDSATEESAIAE